MTTKIKASNIETGAITADKIASGALSGALGYTPASQTDITNAINNLKGGVGSALDTLNELATALNNDASFASTITTALATKANTSSLATVATSGSYNDLTNKPTIPTVSATAISDQDNSSTGYFDVPAGTTAQRPTSPNVGYIRFNTTLGFLEQYTIDGWQGITQPPIITSVSPTSYNGEQSTTITINGSNFDPSSTVQFITSNGTSYSATNVIRISSAQLTAQTPQDFTVANGPLSVKVSSSSGLSSTITSAISTGVAPSWVTASGSLGSVNYASSVNLSVSASDADVSSSITYSLISGSLPPGVNLNTSTGSITGTAPSPTSDTTYTFTLRATDNAGNTAGDRSFSITVIGTNYSIQYLVVAGGGGGGSFGGGAGAGGYLSSSFTASLSTSYSITVGGGGAGSPNHSTYGGNGSNSSIAGVATAIGGGAGGRYAQVGLSGGSGGGGGGDAGTISGGSGTAGQGNAGGTGSSSYRRAGGGGGASAAGTDGNSTPNGGAGSQWFNGNYYSGGGGGGAINGGAAGSGGVGGGGAGRIGDPATPGYDGTANTGGGGGGSGGGTESDGGAGGSGIVILRYAGSQRGTGGSITSSGGYTYHTFTSSSTYTA